MFKTVTRKETRQSRIRRIRAKIKVTAQRPRLCVHRSLAHISVQLIDDLNGKTLASANDKGLTGTPTEKAQAVGKKIAEQAKDC
jgi:large subunit ribosomal protein L18